jgi:TldD protein
MGNDMRLDSGVGTCGKEGQSVPVGVGQPTLRIDGLTVGGIVFDVIPCRVAVLHFKP